MKTRELSLGTRNICGHRVTMARKQHGMKQKDLLARLQIAGIDMNPSELSKLEGQHRYVTDRELMVLADILDVSTDWLIGKERWKN